MYALAVKMFSEFGKLQAICQSFANFHSFYTIVYGFTFTCVSALTRLLGLLLINVYMQYEPHLS